jgi:hypothetical protein
MKKINQRNTPVKNFLIEPESKFWYSLLGLNMCGKIKQNCTQLPSALLASVHASI